MRGEIQADGERWLVRAEESAAEDNVRTFVFHCVSNSSRPYRVVQVPEGVASTSAGRDLDETELRALFDRSQTMDYVHDSDAFPEGHGVRFE